MTIKRACKNDIPFIESSLAEIYRYHRNGRPDIFFRENGVKYTASELVDIIAENIVLVAFDGETPCGYLIAKPETCGRYSSVYVDDLFVVPEKRRMGVGRQLMEEIMRISRENGCYNLTLNVWEFPGSAMEFYKSLGMKPMSHKMEIIF